MKKWLNILGTIGFTTVSTTAIVACKTSESMGDRNNFGISSKLIVRKG